MVMCVWADMSGVTERTVTCAEIKAEVAKLNAATGRIWEVEQRTYRRKRFLRSPVDTVGYALYLDCHGEWQCINFPPTKPGGWSINPTVGYRTLLTMLHWYLAGLSERPVADPASPSPVPPEPSDV